MIELNLGSIEKGAKDYPPIIASMTTIPSRIQLVRPVIEAVFSQSVQIDELEFNIPFTCQRTNEDYQIPEWLSQMDKVRVFRTPDFGAITKIAPTLLRHINDDITHIWSIDDDCAYPRNQLELLISRFQVTKKRILTRYGGAINNGYDFKNRFHGEGPVTFLEGFGGVLYPPGCIGTDFEEYIKLTSLNEDCRRGDDMVLSMYFNKRGIELYFYNNPSNENPYMVEGWLPHNMIDPLCDAEGHNAKYGRIFDYINGVVFSKRIHS